MRIQSSNGQKKNNFAVVFQVTIEVQSKVDLSLQILKIYKLGVPLYILHTL